MKIMDGDSDYNMIIYWLYRAFGRYDWWQLIIAVLVVYCIFIVSEEIIIIIISSC